jgi:hypothetical protein
LWHSYNRPEKKEERQLARVREQIANARKKNDEISSVVVSLLLRYLHSDMVNGYHACYSNDQNSAEKRAQRLEKDRKRKASAKANAMQFVILLLCQLLRDSII